MNNAYALLLLTTLSWAGNAIAGRLAVGEVSPMVLVALRWAVVVVILFVIARDKFIADLPALKARWGTVVFMGALGYTAFNALFYAAAHYTSGVNMTIVQGSIPVFVIVGGLLVFGTAVKALQAIGCVITFGGVAVLASKGDIAQLAALGFNIGDLYMLIAGMLYAGYTLALRRRPAVSGLAFFTAMALSAAVTSLPLLAWEIASGAAQWPTHKGWLIVLFIALFPSLVSQLSFMRSVELIGPQRAGLFVNLVPVFGAFMAVTILGEPFGWYHGAALALVIGGILVAETAKKAP